MRGNGGSVRLHRIPLMWALWIAALIARMAWLLRTLEFLPAFKNRIGENHFQSDLPLGKLPPAVCLLPHERGGFG